MEAKEFLSTIEVRTTYDKVMDTIERIFETTEKKIPEKERDKVLHDIKSRNLLKQLIK